MDAELVTGL